MHITIIIPAHNEEAFIAKTLQSLVEQTCRPTEIIVVNDNSTDKTQQIIDSFSNKFPFIRSMFLSSAGTHEPGSKIVNAFNYGLQNVTEDFEVVCKFDADLIFPKNYIERILAIFSEDKTIGMVGGFCYIEKNGLWFLENLTNKDHIRGALKAYRKECLKQIGGLKSTMGWDTIDEILAKYHGWKITTDTALHVKHLKPTGNVYTKSAKFKQGEAFYKMRYGFFLSTIASAKLAVRKKSLTYFVDCVKGYFKSKKNGVAFVISKKEGVFLRSIRWYGIKRKLF